MLKILFMKISVCEVLNLNCIYLVCFWFFI